MCCAVILLLVPAGCRAQSWEFWNSYAATFIDARGRVVDHSAGDITTSEGQSYALFFSVVAGDRPRFDKVLDWTREYLAVGDLAVSLPAWKWGNAPDGQWKVLDPNSASDSDLWICYSLLEAGRLWHVPRYTALGRVMATHIASSEVAELPGFGPMLLPGPTGFHPNSATWLLNPSYVPLPLLERLAVEDPGGPWSRMAASLPKFLQQTSIQGFPMDWVTYNASSGFSPAAAPGGSAGVPMGSYDAIRVYLWAGMANPNTPGSKAGLDAVSGMARYLGTASLPPSQVNSEGNVVNLTAPIGFSGALIPYLESQGKSAALKNQKDHILAGRDTTTLLYGRPPTYYDQNLLLFGVGWEQRFFRFDRTGQLKVKWDKA
jgi:endo-1,4-beta-D-glucanase Y